MGRGPCVRTAARQRRETRERRGLHHGYSVPSGRPAVLGHLAVHFVRAYGVQRVGTHVAVGRHRAVRGCSHRADRLRVAHHGGSRQRVRHGHVVQLGEDIFGTCRLLGLHGAALREVARRGRHDAPPVREAFRRSSWPSTSPRPSFATFRCSASACGKAAWSRTCGLCRVPGTS